MTKIKRTRPKTTPLSETDAQLLWLSLHQQPIQPGNLDGVIRKLASDALLKMLLDNFGNPKRIRAVSRWIAARVRGTPLCQTERDLIR